MQSLDDFMSLGVLCRLLRRAVKLRLQQNPETPNPTFISFAIHAAERVAEMIGGIPQSGLMEALFNIPGTAHILGGAPIGATVETGVVDARHRVFGYRNLLV